MFRNVAKEELKVPGRVEYLGELRDFVTRVGKKYGFSERIINAFKLSIDEAATNIIKHAYRDWEGDITLRAVAKKNSLTMVLVDQGKYFDPRQVNSPDLQRYVEIGKKGGLGIFIMRRLLDSIDYRKTEDGNELWMVKNRDEEKKPKFSFSTIPLSLKMRYWLYSIAIFTMILFTISAYNYINRKQQMVDRYLNSGQLGCEATEGSLKNLWKTVTPDAFILFKVDGSREFEVCERASDAIESIRNSEEYQDMLKGVIITSSRDEIIASSDSVINELCTIESIPFVVPDGAPLLRELGAAKAYLLLEEGGEKTINISQPVFDNDDTKLANVHFQIDYRLVTRDINRYRRALISEVFLIWGIVSAGLFLLIYVVMYPFQRLQEWVKNMNEPGVRQEMDIDASTEIGAIAQAFSDMTAQLRRSQEDLVEQERLQQEMHIAKQIQQTLLPTEFPKLEGYDIGSFYAAAKEVGGDFYDFVEVDKETLGVAVADVSGKGVPGAFVMTMIRTALRSEARGVKDAAEVLAKVNDFVVNDMKKGMFVTLFYVIIDSKKRRLNFASAGHNPMILHRPSKNKTYYLNPRGFPIGISLPDKNLFRQSIQSDTIALAEDDILLVYTDGVTEAMNPKRRLFGEERFLRLIRECGKQTAEEFVDRLKKDMNTFTEGSEQSDDITLVAIKEKTSAERVEYERAVRAYQLIQGGAGIKDACRDAGISTYSYYQRYKEKFDTEGVGNFVATAEDDQIEAKHLSIEEKNKIFDVIRRFPEYGAKRINEELNTARYENTEIPVSKIYEELVRMRLNTKELREAFVARGGKKKRIKPPGTPMMTIDGKIIMNRAQYDETAEEPEPPVVVEKADKEEPPRPAEKAPEPPEEVELPEVPESSAPNVFAMDKKTLLTAPLEEILDKRAPQEGEPPVEKTEEPPEPIDELEHLSAAADDDFAEMFGFVEEEATPEDEPDEPAEEPPLQDAAAGKFTVVTAAELQEFDEPDFDENEELEQIKDSLDEPENELEILANYSDEEDQEEFEEFVDLNFVEDEETPEEVENLAFQKELERLDDDADEDDDAAEEAEIFDLEEHPSEFVEAEFYNYDDRAAADEIEAADPEIEPEEIFPAIPPKTADLHGLFEEEQDLFGSWAAETSEDSPNAGIDNESDITEEMGFVPDNVFDDPFEEFLELEDEGGLINDNGELDYEVARQLLEVDDSFVEESESQPTPPEATSAQAQEAAKEEDTEAADEQISLDELVSVSDAEEPLLSREDEEFDKLIRDALSNDGKKRPILKESAAAAPHEQQNDIETELNAAIVLYREANFDDVIVKLNKLAEKFPQDFRTHSLLGNAYFREKKFKEASSEYERVIDLDPLNEHACENLAIAYAKQGELEKAIHSWERLLNITPHRMDVRLSIQQAKAFLNKLAK